MYSSLVSSEFEVFFAQLDRLQPESVNNVSNLKARLNELAYSYAGNLGNPSGAMLNHFDVPNF